MKGAFLTYKVFALILVVMKKFLILCIAFCSAIIVQAQKVYFIYLQSDNGSPFYIRMGEKVNSSTAEGYLILPKLTDSTYTFTVGQPGKKEFQFSLTINKADRGFLIKNSEGVLTLFDLQTFVVYKPLSSPLSSAAQTIIRNDHFSKLLARAADDTTLLTEVVFTQAEPVKKKETAEPLVVKEESAPKQDSPVVSTTAVAQQAEDKKLPDSNSTAAVVDTGTLTTGTSALIAVAEVKDTVITTEQPAERINNKEPLVEVKDQPVMVQEEVFNKSVVVKKSESSTSDGFGLTFLDTYNGQVDTIQLTIPNPHFFIADTMQKQSDSKEFLEISSQTAASAKAPVESKSETATAEKLKPVCLSQASDDDFFKLRRDMAAEKEEEDMVAQARKYFKGKCFRSEQIKYLSTLFLTDSGKYHFFDAAYLHVSDQDKFGTLIGELKDTYYTNRFKTLVAQ